MVITILRSPFRQRQGERANTTNLDWVLWHALAIGSVCGVQCTWTAVPAKPRSSHCTGTPLGLVARGRSLSDQINSDMSTDITGHYAPAHTIVVCHVGGCLPIGHASGLLEMWRPAGSLLQEFSVPFERTGPLATRRRLGAAVARLHVLGGVSTWTTVFPPCWRHLWWGMFWRGRAQSTSACMSLSGPVGLATRERMAGVPLHGCNTLLVHCHPPPRYVIMWWRGTALPSNGPASQPAGFGRSDSGLAGYYCQKCRTCLYRIQNGLRVGLKM
jgi:hypothetical protein